MCELQVPCFLLTALPHNSFTLTNIYSCSGLKSVITNNLHDSEVNFLRHVSLKIDAPAVTA